MAAKRPLPNRAMHAVFGRINQKKQWYEQPTLGLKMLNLLSLRLDLRDLNLFDARNRTAAGEREPPDPGGGQEGPPARRPLERPARPGHGLQRQRLLPQHQPASHPAREAAAPSRPQPREVSLELMTRRRVQAGHHPEHPRRSLDPVREPQLVLPRPRHRRGDHRGAPRRGRRLAREPDARAPDGHARRRQRRAGRGRRGQRQRQRQGRRLRQHRDPLVGRVADLRVEQGAAGPPAQLRGRQAGDRRRRPCCPRTPTSAASTSPASTRTGGSGSPACTRCSPRSTTRSATCSRRRTRAGTTSACSTPPGSSTPR